MPVVIAIANQKGGVGKTTTAVNLGAVFAAQQRSVWLIDLDPQGNATTSLGQAPHTGLLDALLARTPLDRHLLETPSARLHLIAGGTTLTEFEALSDREPHRERRLHDAIASACSPPHIVVIDCPPSLSLLTTNALVAADHIVIPLQCEFLALQGLGQFLGSVEQVRKRANPHLAVLGIALTMHDRRNNLSELVADNVRAALPGKVFTTVIPRNVRASEAPSHGLPLLLYDVRSPSAQAYIALGAEILERLELSA